MLAKKEFRLDGTLNINENVVFESIPSLEIKTNKIIKNGFSSSTCGIKINFDKVNLSTFNRVSIWMNINATGYQNFYFHFMLGKKLKWKHSYQFFRDDFEIF